MVSMSKFWQWCEISPHGFYDLVRLARRGRSTLVRTVYALALLFVLMLNHDRTSTGRTVFTMPRIEKIAGQLPRYKQQVNENARIAQEFSISILMAQNFAVLILMPIYCAASMQDERDRQALPLLFTTQLSDLAIVQGKLLSRAGHVGSILLTGLPILAMVQVWGGIDMPTIIANYCITGLLLCSVGALSLFIAIRIPNMFGALTVTYGLIFGALFIATISCFHPVDGRDPLDLFVVVPHGIKLRGGKLPITISLAWITIVHVFLALLFVGLASLSLRELRRREEIPHSPESPVTGDIVTPDEAPPGYDRPPVTEPALIWKECHRQPYTLLTVTTYLVIAALLFALTVAAICLPRSRFDLYANLHATCIADVKASTFIAAGAFILSATLYLTGSIVRERQRRTLDALLMIPAGRAALLACILRASFRRYRLWLLPVAVGLVVLMTNALGLHYHGIPLMLALASHLAFFATLGLFLSVVCRTVAAAYISLSLILAFILLAPSFLLHRLNVGEEAKSICHDIIEPVATWMILSFPEQPGSRQAYAMLGPLLYGMSACILWTLSWMRLCSSTE